MAEHGRAIPSDQLVVACVLWMGRFNRRARNPYNPKWVKRLRSMVARNLSIPHRFVCLSNIDIPDVDVIRLKHNWPGWWSKIELFGPSIQAKRIISFDLDVLITGSLDELVLDPAPIKFMPPHHKIMGSQLRPQRGVVPMYQSSCMVWSPPTGREIYDKFNKFAMEHWLGDQDWIATVNPGWPTFDPKWFRKIRQCPEGPPPDVKIVLAMPIKNVEASLRWPWAKAIWQ